MMNEPINIEARSDRELLVIAVQKLNFISDRVANVCNQVGVNTPRITELERTISNHSRLIKVIISGVLAFSVAVVTYVLAHIGFPGANKM